MRSPAVALVFRLFTGRLSDRSGRRWLLWIAGEVINDRLGVGAIPVTYRSRWRRNMAAAYPDTVLRL